jgi:hydroxyacylglutathione hydrolase
MVQVKSFYAKNDLRNFTYLIWDKNSGSAWVIDPFDDKAIIDYIKKEHLVLRGILNTHQHWDHTRGNEGLKSLLNCSVMDKKDSPLSFGEGHKLRFLETPGHTIDHQAFIWEQEDKFLSLFSGDTLFNSGVGNCRDGGNVEKLFETTKMLSSLGDDLVLFPGHDYVMKNLLFAKNCEPENSDIDEAIYRIKQLKTEDGLGWTLGDEKKINPFLRLDSVQIRQNLLSQQIGLDDETQIERHLFKKLRELRDNW